ncbi:MFS transporter [Xanthobacter sediminis]|uniref:MFS transporter n=1 Tax=Xanthobacter sediminis TaxID=3119926 RepID=UPI0037285328
MIIDERVGAGGVDRTTLAGWVVWGTAALFYLYEFFVRVAPSAMEPELQAHFGLSAAALGAAAGAYYFVYSPMQLLSGTVIDRFGAKHTLVVAALICTAGAFVELMGTSPLLLSAARFLQGLGSAFAFVGTMYLAAQWFPRSMLALLAGLTTSLGMAGAILGNSGTAFIVETLGWRSALLAAGGLGIVIVVLIMLLVRSHPSAGAAGGKAPAPHILKALRVVWSNPQSWYLGIVGAALYMPLSILGALWGEDYIAAVTGADPEEAAFAVSLMYVGWLVGGPVAGLVSDRYGTRRILLLGASIATCAVTLAIALIPQVSLPGMYGLMLLLGLASTSQVVCFASAVEHNPPEVTGTAIAATNMMIMLLGGLGEWGFGALLDTFGAGAGKALDPQAFRFAIGLLPAVCIVGLGAALLLTEAREREPAAEVAAA